MANIIWTVVSQKIASTTWCNNLHIYLQKISRFSRVCPRPKRKPTFTHMIDYLYRQLTTTRTRFKSRLESNGNVTTISESRFHCDGATQFVSCNRLSSTNTLTLDICPSPYRTLLNFWKKNSKHPWKFLSFLWIF